jgi:hypothetical protein
MLHSIPEPVDPVGNAPFLNLQHSCYVATLHCKVLLLHHSQLCQLLFSLTLGASGDQFCIQVDG